MAVLRQIITRWVTASGSGKATVMYFDATVSISTQRSAISALFTTCQAQLSNTVNWTVDTAGIDVDGTTGGLAASWSEAVARQGVGASSNQPVADTTQVLLKWRTASIVGGRFLQGRTFLPGLTATNLVNGNLGSGAQTVFAGAATTMAGSAAGFEIWHRPVSGTGGLGVAVSGSQVPFELAVLRRRRN